MADLDRAIEAAAKVLLEAGWDCYNEESARGAAREAVEAAAPHLLYDNAVGVAKGWKQRAERAEAEVDELQQEADLWFRCIVHECCEEVQNERALADQLAKALVGSWYEQSKVEALAAWKRARYGS